MGTADSRGRPPPQESPLGPPRPSLVTPRGGSLWRPCSGPLPGQVSWGRGPASCLALHPAAASPLPGKDAHGGLGLLASSGALRRGLGAGSFSGRPSEGWIPNVRTVAFCDTQSTNEGKMLNYDGREISFRSGPGRRRLPLEGAGRLGGTCSAVPKGGGAGLAWQVILDAQGGGQQPVKGCIRRGAEPHLGMVLSCLANPAGTN